MQTCTLNGNKNSTGSTFPDSGAVLCLQMFFQSVFCHLSADHVFLSGQTLRQNLLLIRKVHDKIESRGITDTCDNFKSGFFRDNG